MIACSMTSLPPMLLSSCVLQVPLSPCAFIPTRKYLARMQHDFPATYVIVQLCSSGTFITMCFHSHKEIFGMHLKKCCYRTFLLYFKKNCASHEAPVTDSCELCFYILCYSCLKESDHTVYEHNLALHRM